MPAVFIDVGHGGTESGAVANNIVEKNINLIVGLKLKEHLLRCGFAVKMSRENDITVALESRATIGKNWGMDLFVSVHHNAGGGDGYETIHQLFSPGSKKLAELVASEFGKLGQNKRAIYSRRYDDDINSAKYNTEYYCVLRMCSEYDIPAIITEYAFLDTKDYLSVDTDEELYAEAEAIAKALCKYFDVLYIEENIQPVYQNSNPIKQTGVDFLKEQGLFKSDHDPKETITAETLGLVMRNLFEKMGW